MCYHFKQKNGARPMCESKKRTCPVEDIAPNIHAQKFIDMYKQAKIAAHNTGLNSIQESIFQSLGLFDNLELLLALEKVWLDYLEFKRKRDGR